MVLIMKSPYYRGVRLLGPTGDNSWTVISPIDTPLIYCKLRNFRAVHIFALSRRALVRCDVKIIIIKKKIEINSICAQI